MTTADRLRTMLIHDYKLDSDQLTEDARLEDLGIDSLGMADFVFNIEDQFGLTIPDVATALTTFGEVAHFVEDLIATRDSTLASPRAVAENSLRTQ